MKSYLYLLGTTFALISVCVCEDMSIFRGTYDQITDPRNDDLNEIMKAAEFSYADREEMRKVRFRLEIVKNILNRTVTVTAASVWKTHIANFQLGKEFEEVFLNGKKSRTLVTTQGNIARKVMSFDSGITLSSESTFSNVGIETNIKCKYARAVLKFQRMSGEKATSSLLNLDLI